MNIFDKVMNINRIKEAIIASKIGKSELSKLAKVSRTTIDNLLLGADVKVSTIENLAHVLKVPVGFFFDDSNVIHVSASGNQSIATNSGDVTIGEQNVNKMRLKPLNASDSISTHEKEYNVATLTKTVSTLTKELEVSQQQKGDLISVVANSQKQIQQLTNMIDRLTQ